MKLWKYTIWLTRRALGIRGEHVVSTKLSLSFRCMDDCIEQLFGARMTEMNGARRVI